MIRAFYGLTQNPFDARELELLTRITREIGRPLSFTVQQNDQTPDRFRQLLDAIAGWNAAGATARAQVAVRPIGVLIGLTASASPLLFSPTARQLHHLPLAERVATLAKPSTPIVQNEIRPFVIAARPLVRDLKPASINLAKATPNLSSTFTV